jgi:hypothetical protein
MPQPPPPGLYITIGPQNLASWALERITKTLVVPSRIVWVDAANAFNAYLVGVAARSVLKDPRQALSSFQVARPFTAYQLEAMVSEKTLPAVRQSKALFAVISDPLRMFLDTEGRDTQVSQCYARFLNGIKNLTQEAPVLLLTSTLPKRYTMPLFDLALRFTHLSFIEHRSSLLAITRTEALAIR